MNHLKARQRPSIPVSSSWTWIRSNPHVFEEKRDQPDPWCHAAQVNRRREDPHRPLRSQRREFRQRALLPRKPSPCRVTTDGPKPSWSLEKTAGRRIPSGMPPPDELNRLKGENADLKRVLAESIRSGSIGRSGNLRMSWHRRSSSLSNTTIQHVIMERWARDTG